MEEWYATGEEIIPYAIRRLDYHKFDNYINCLEIKDNKYNIGSAKSIQNNDGILENEVIVDGIVEQRFWINIG